MAEWWCEGREPFGEEPTRPEALRRLAAEALVTLGLLEPLRPPEMPPGS